MNLNDIMIFLKQKFEKEVRISFSIFFQILLFYGCNVIICITQCLFTSQCEWHHMTSKFFKELFFQKNCNLFFMLQHAYSHHDV
jgi:hypothetical protein